MLKKSAYVSILSLLVSVVSFINQIIIAKLFGATYQLDVFLSVTAVPTMIGGLISTALSYSLIPHLLNFKNSRNSDYRKYVSLVTSKVLLVSGVLTIVGFAIFSLFGQHVYVSLKGANSFYLMAFISWASCFFSIFTNLYGCLLNVEEKFIQSVVLNFFPFLFSIIFCLFLYHYINIFSLLLGILSGSIVATLVASYWLPKNTSSNAKDALLTRSANAFLKTMPYVSIAMICFTMYQTVDAYWASKIGSSNLSYLSYCQRILIALGTLVISGPSVILIPRLSKALAEGKENEFYGTTISVIKIIFLITGFMAVLVSLLAMPIVRLMFQRGAFTDKDTIAVAAIMPYMLCGMVFMLNVVMLFRVSFLKNMQGKLAFVGLLSLVLYFSFSGIGIHFFGIKGIASAYILSWVGVWSFLIYFLFENKMFVYVLNKQNAYFIIKLIVLLVVLFLSGTFLNSCNSFSESNETMQAIYKISFITPIMAFVFIVFAKLFRVKEVEIFFQVVPLRKMLNKRMGKGE